MNTNKYILITLLGVFFSFNLLSVNAQKMNDSDRLSIGVWIPDQIEGLTPAAYNILENKLNQIISTNGLGDTPYARFIVSANVVVITKNITPTAPPMHAYTLDVTFYIGDGFEGKSFASHTISTKGVGENETKAYINALKGIKANDAAFKTFIDKGKAKILAYYETNCDFIITEAKTLAATQQYDRAIWLLTSVPTVCTDCYNKSMNAVPPIFQQKIDLECKQKLNAATNVWNAGQDWNAANEAGTILSTINPNAACYGEVNGLAGKISKRIYEIDKREWDFAVYKAKAEVEVKKDLINAYREIGVAYGNGQPKTIIYKSFW